MAAPSLKEAAAAIFDAQKSPFGPISLSAESHRATTLPDAVRRCRWIAIDLGAAEFGVYFVGPSAERARLTACFDSDYPHVSVSAKFLTGSNGEDIVRHARRSTLPLRWSADRAAPSHAALARLVWAAEVTPPAPETAGLAFPVYAERGRSGVVVFMGPELTVDAAGLGGIHARCFSLFDAVTRLKPGEGAKAPAVSKRELECLKLAANGYTSEEIAGLLKLSVHTANQYLASAAQKLNAVGRMHAVAKALRMGLID